jgi:hypothetical protein
MTIVQGSRCPPVSARSYSGASAARSRAAFTDHQPAADSLLWLTLAGYIKGPGVLLLPALFPFEPRRIGPVIRLDQQAPAGSKPKRKPASVFGTAPDMTEEELQRRGDAADELWCEPVRRAALPDGE